MFTCALDPPNEEQRHHVFELLRHLDADRYGFYVPRSVLKGNAARSRVTSRRGTGSILDRENRA